MYHVFKSWNVLLQMPVMGYSIDLLRFMSVMSNFIFLCTEHQKKIITSLELTLTLAEIHCIKLFGDTWATCIVLLIKHIIKTKGCCIRILENAVKSLSLLYHESQTRLTLHHTQKVVYKDSEHSVAIHSLFFQSWFWCSVFELVLH